MPNGLKTALLLGLMSGLLLAIGEVLGGANGLLIAFIFAAVMNFGSYWFSDKIVLRMYHAQEVAPGHRLYSVVERLSRQANLPMPKVYIIPDPSPNAFATGRNPEHAAVAATEGILKILSDSELEGVIAHELAHVKHRDILISSVAATIAAAIMFAARTAQFAAMFGGRRRRADYGKPLWPGGRASEDRRRVEAGAARRQPGDRTHVHRQAIHRRWVDVALQQPSADRSAHPRAARGEWVGRSTQPWSAVVGNPPFDRCGWLTTAPCSRHFSRSVSN